MPNFSLLKGAYTKLAEDYLKQLKGGLQPSYAMKVNVLENTNLGERAKKFLELIEHHPDSLTPQHFRYSLNPKALTPNVYEAAEAYARDLEKGKWGLFYKGYQSKYNPNLHIEPYKTKHFTFVTDTPVQGLAYEGTRTSHQLISEVQNNPYLLSQVIQELPRDMKQKLLDNSMIIKRIRDNHQWKQQLEPRHGGALMYKYGVPKLTSEETAMYLKALEENRQILGAAIIETGGLGKVRVKLPTDLTGLSPAEEQVFMKLGENNKGIKGSRDLYKGKWLTMDAGGQYYKKLGKGAKPITVGLISPSRGADFYGKTNLENIEDIDRVLQAGIFEIRSAKNPLLGNTFGIPNQSLKNVILINKQGGKLKKKWIPKQYSKTK